MSISIVPHLNFRGQARQALEFYQTVFGGTLTVVTYREAHSSQDPAEAEQVMWGQVAAEQGFTLMAFDALPSRLPFDQGQNAFYVAARLSTPEQTTACWNKLKEGATIRHDLAPAPWAPILYGMLQDRFGIIWIISEDSSS